MSCAFVSSKGRERMNQKSKGFTLIELMIVVGIMGILGLIGGITIVKVLPGYQLQKAAREMVGNFRKARSMAIKLNRPVSVEFFVTQNQYEVDGKNALPAASTAQENLPAYYGGGVKLGFPGRGDCVHFTKGVGGADAGDTIVFNTTGLTQTAEPTPVPGVVGYVYIQNSKGQGYRIGVSGLAANIKMDQCGTKDSNGLLITCLE
jgi:prepilin-type N-terminal cleavage/methylation domain-containing protein